VMRHGVVRLVLERDATNERQQIPDMDRPLGRVARICAQYDQARFDGRVHGERRVFENLATSES